jgi:NitT/TauT family transport system permease protein
MAHLATSRRRRSARPRDRGLIAPATPRARSLGGAVPAVVALGALALWEALVRTGVVGPLWFPAPTRIAARFGELTASGELGRHFGVTLSRLLPGVVLGGVPGLLLGLSMGWSARLRTVVDPFVAAFHPVPKLAILPLIMVLVGIGETSKVLLVAVASFFPMAINAMAGVRHISPLHFEVAENYGARRFQVLRRVVLPASLPFSLSGLRLALNSGFGATIGSEIVTAREGLGAMMWLAWEVLRVADIYVALVVISLIGVGFNQLVLLLLRRLVPWQPERPPAR